MSKSLTKFGDRQPQSAVERATVELPLPLLATLEDAQSAFFGLCVTAGKQVLEAMMEADRTALCGPAGRHAAARGAGRAGTTPSRVVLGGREIALQRLRVRSVSDGELALPSFRAAAASDPLDCHTLEAIASGVSMRRYGRSLDPLPPGEREHGTNRNAVSRRLVALTEAKLGAWFEAPLGGLDLCVVMIDGIVFLEHCVLLALGIDSDGNKHALGLREGTTENAAVAKALLSELIERGLKADRPLLFVIDGAKALQGGSPGRSARPPSYSAARSTSCATSSRTCPSGCVRAWRRPCIRRGRRRTRSSPGASSNAWRPRSRRSIRAPRRRSARASTRR